MRTLTQPLIILWTALRRIFASPLAGLLNILVIGIALSLPAGMYVLLQNAQGLVAQLSGPQQISLFLALDASQEDIAQLRTQLSRHPAIASVKFVSRNDALEELKQSSGLDDVIAGLESNPLPDAFVIVPKPGSAKSLDELRTALQNMPKVEQAQHDSAWAYKLDALLSFARVAVFILSGLLSLALIAITFNTIRLQILTQRDEIQVAKLIGASNGFIRRPFLFFGALQGLLGGITALLIISTSLLLLQPPLATLSRLYASNFSLQPLSLGDVLSLLLFSVYLGLLGAWLSVSRHLSHVESH
ncbi:MAG: ABC transporter permease [Gallionellales bacterium CG03_land_8_20_14_0_80_55_15]|nr:MAG: ABC transporter permease [Gallionellales bacterium CG03_land_8_20_14_0_80_55_15]PIX04684.1 MAG: ABC transporter permease [Gallionellales bacterium CG_4_8_14_3_um_filter_54_18]PJC03405.1 MAG: ABC transporter permease [Gallionellales bacterium CG_4_9_14_0_8_um_filter_55_61]HCJ51922.1 ABC transporter permease [Gallionella sp.]